MANRMTSLTILAIAIICLASCTGNNDINIVNFETHILRMSIDVPSRSATVDDAGTMQVKAGWNLFYLNGEAKISKFALEGSEVSHVSSKLSDSSGLPAGVVGDLPESDIEGDPKQIFFEAAKSGQVAFELSFKAEFFQDVSNMRFSNEQVGGEVTGTISEQGAYLSSAAYFYPQGNEELSEYKLTADIPLEWECVSDGNQLSHEVLEKRKLVSFGNPFRSDGLMFMAAPYVVKTTMADEVEVACFFFEADSSLIEGYLSASVDYIKMYSEMIGPYPFKRFSVVENFFPTGYGMPAWTLLGQQVIRLPFIKSTSLGHEVLHNWWGNSVYVDYERGNWCESATVYGADYRYKLKSSDEAAKGYRKDILKQYVSYVSEENDFPIREFKSRTSPGTRTIGYNKAMMVYHMIENELGSEDFFEAWRLIYSRHQTEKISWEEWITAFEETSGMNLSHIIPQWIDQPGAPVLSLDVVGVEESENGKQVTFAVSDASDQHYRLDIPVRFAGGGTAVDTSVLLTEKKSEFVITVPAGIETIELDPDYHLFRKLYPEEVEPIVSAIMGIETKRFIAAANGEEALLNFQSFAENVSGDSVTIESMNDLVGGDADQAPILLNPSEIPAYLSTRIKLGDDSVEVDGVAYPREGHTLVLTGDDFGNFGKFMVVISADFESLPRIGQLIPHYGKYSYLVFNGSRNVGKGQWTPDSSPLKKSL